jgi:hypothetical protein
MVPAAERRARSHDMQPTVDGRVEPVVHSTGRDSGRHESARRGSGLATVYRLLDRLVAHYDLRDAALVIDVPGLGHQVLHAGRRPLHNDAHGLHHAEPGLYADPPLDSPIVADLMLAIGELGLLTDTRSDPAHSDPQGERP